MATEVQDFRKIEVDKFNYKASKCTCKPDGMCTMTKDVCNMAQCPFVLWEKLCQT